MISLVEGKKYTPDNCDKNKSCNNVCNINAFNIGSRGDVATKKNKYK